MIIKLHELKDLESKATCGPWTWMYPDDKEGSDIVNRTEGGYFDDFIIQRDSGVYGPTVDTCEFIMMMREAAPRLIAIAEAALRLQAEWEKIRNMKDMPEFLKRIMNSSLDPQYRYGASISLYEALHGVMNEPPGKTQDA